MRRELRLTRTSQAVLQTLIDGFEDELWGLRICHLTKLPSGTVYPLLARLEDLGWVETSWEGDGRTNTRTTGPRRRFYRLTPNGLIAARTTMAESNSDVKTTHLHGLAADGPQ
ncbi:PadR family transcriptional regulator [Catenulispora subtropica]|uniref:Transcription regulator PadR N-terminal domain-containing protein n=1 Tax=Catenulispora subtropica TaxID=450798 RepID=A0ABN2R4X0_9ACTN